MKQFLAFVKKEFFHIFRDRRTLLILLGMPIAQIILFGFAISTEITSVRTGVLDQPGDVESQRLIDRLDASRYFDLVARVGNNEEINRLFQRGEAALVVAFPPDFTASLKGPDAARIQLIADASNPNEAVTITNYATQIIMNRSAAPGAAPVTTRMLYNPKMKSAYNFVPGVMGLILMLVCAMMTSIAIVREKETGTMEILLVSPIRPFLIIVAKTVPYMLLSLVNVITILLLSRFVLDVPVAGSVLLLLGVSLLFITVSLSLGILISTMTDSQQVAMMMAGAGLMLPVVMLSGMMFPIESMPRPLQILSAFVPARYYIIAVRNVMIKGLGVQGIINEVVILASMLVCVTALSLNRFKIRL